MPFRSRGFTLVELMVVVVIIAILAAIAIPSYRRYAMRAHRADAQNLLMHIATAEERYYSTNNEYTDDLTQFGYAAKSNVPSEHDYYTAAVAVQNKNQQFTATATPQNGQADDKCGAMSIDNAGTKLPARTDASANSNGHCW